MADFTPKHHPTEDALELFSMGRLARHEQEPVEEHLLICESCRSRVEELDQYTSALRSALRQVNPDPEPSSRSISAAIFGPGKPALAFIAVCAVLLIVIPAVRTTRRTAAQPVELAAVRGGTEAVARAGTPLELRLPAAGLEANAQAKIEIVTSGGQVQWTGSAPLRDDKWVVQVDRSLGSGNYFVRAYSPATSELLREYPLVLQ